jgi:hypothetical protein
VRCGSNNLFHAVLFGFLCIVTWVCWLLRNFSLSTYILLVLELLQSDRDMNSESFVMWYINCSSTSFIVGIPYHPTGFRLLDV